MKTLQTISLFLYIAMFAMCGDPEPIEPTFEAYPNDHQEIWVLAGKTIIVVDDAQTIYQGTDTTEAINAILSDFNGLMVWKGDCRHYEPDSIPARAILHQLIAGAPCQNNIISFY